MRVEELRDRLAEALAETGAKHPFTTAQYIIQSRGQGEAEAFLRDLLLNGEDEEAATAA